MRHWVPGGEAMAKWVLIRISMVAMRERFDRPVRSVWKRAKAIGAKTELVRAEREASASTCNRGQLIRSESTNPAREDPVGKSLGREQICMSEKSVVGIEVGKR